MSRSDRVALWLTRHGLESIVWALGAALLFAFGYIAVRILSFTITTLVLILGGIFT